MPETVTQKIRLLADGVLVAESDDPALWEKLLPLVQRAPAAHPRREAENGR